jgi:L-galactose dehydrogenase
LQAPLAIVTRNLDTERRVERRVLGQTSLEVSILGFGASPLGNVFDQTDPAEGIAAVRYAIDNDINFFDVSPYYGLTLAETQLGKALQGYRHRVVLATKCGRYGAKDFNFSAKRISSELEKSLKRLHTEHVDLLQAHDVEFGDVHQIVEETIPAMRVLQQQGKARYIGITGYSLRNLMQIASRVKVDNILTYCRYNLLIDDMGKMLVPFAKAHGIGVVNASPLHMGIITRRGAPVWHPAPTEVREVGQQIMELCASRGYDASELALKYCFDNKDVASTFVGISSREHVDASLRALQMKGDAALLGDIAERVKPVRNFVWPSGRVENRD